MARLRELTGPSRRTGLSAVVSAVEGEQHFMGARMVADLLEQEGWAVDFLGPNTPGPDLIALVAGRRPVDLLVVSVTMDQLLTSVRQLSDGIRALLSPPKIMVGGLAARGRPDLAASLEVDYVASDAADAVAAAAALVASSAAPNPPHEWLLQTIGRNVLELRKRRGWSQQELAAAAGLDRTYISGVERGRQNLTVGSLLSLAQALESPFGDLLVTEPARA
jgi:DNA-binding XRE family transcriptional regulator